MITVSFENLIKNLVFYFDDLGLLLYELLIDFMIVHFLGMIGLLLQFNVKD